MAKKKVTKKNDDGTTTEVEVDSNSVTVRVKGNQPIAENGAVYQPARKVPNKSGGLDTVAADTFALSPERAAALGDVVEILPE